MIRRHVLVHGIVQGVGFRYSAQREAERRGLVGWVRNRPDGTVECEIEGDDASIDAMLGWLAAGPPGAVVERADVAVTPLLGEVAFRITG